MNILVTGASSGIGNYLANELSGSHNVIGLARRSHPRVSVRADLLDWNDTKRASEQLACDLGAIIHCAGNQGEIGLAMNADPVRWVKSVSNNVAMFYHVVRAFYPKLSSARRSKIIAMSGGGSCNSRPYFSAYAAAKSAIVRCVETFAEEMRHQPVDINAVAPGACYTTMTDEVIELGELVVGKDEMAQAQRIKDSRALPVKALELVRWLLSGQSDHVSGKLISALHDDYRTSFHGETNGRFVLRRVT